MRSVERREVDAVLEISGRSPRILEVDEKQHFNQYRAATLRRYPNDLPLGFDRELWIAESEKKTRLEAGGFARPMPPLFPGGGGRHRQRAFRDALCDILPPTYGFAPALRIGDFEVRSWVGKPGDRALMKNLLRSRLFEVHQC
jgi:hypothetical protein